MIHTSPTSADGGPSRSVRHTRSGHCGWAHRKYNAGPHDHTHQGRGRQARRAPRVSNKKALGTDSHRGYLHCLPHMVNSSSRTDILWPVLTEQIEYQLDQKQDADGSHVALHTPQAFHPHSLITLQAGGNSGNGVRRNRRASWKDRRCSPESTGCLFADLGHVPFQTDRWPTFLFVLSDMRPSRSATICVECAHGKPEPASSPCVRSQ